VDWNERRAWLIEEGSGTVRGSQEEEEEEEELIRIGTRIA